MKKNKKKKNESKIKFLHEPSTIIIYQDALHDENSACRWLPSGLIVLFEMKRNEVKSVLCDMKICTLQHTVIVYYDSDRLLQSLILLLFFFSLHFALLLGAVFITISFKFIFISF